MKKFILLLILGLFIIPSNVFGLEFHVSESKIGGATKGDFVEIDVSLSMEEWKTVDTSNTGVMMYLIGLEYNTDDLILLGAEAKNYITTVMKDQDSDMYVVSLVYGGSQDTTCSYGYLSCGESTNVSINFRLKNKNCEDTNITIDEAIAVVATVTSVEDANVEITDMLESTYYFTHKVKFPENIKVTTPTKTSKISTFDIKKYTYKPSGTDSDDKTAKISTTKRITTKNVPSTKSTTKTIKSSVTSKSTTEESKEESLKNNDIVANIINESKKIISKLKDKKEQEKLLKYGLIVIGVIILIIIIVKIKNYKVNKKFKDF